jgi:hypothetical protein
MKCFASEQMRTIVDIKSQESFHKQIDEPLTAWHVATIRNYSEQVMTSLHQNEPTGLLA